MQLFPSEWQVEAAFGASKLQRNESQQALEYKTLHLFAALPEQCSERLRIILAEVAGVLWIVLGFKGRDGTCNQDFLPFDVGSTEDALQKYRKILQASAYGL